MPWLPPFASSVVQSDAGKAWRQRSIQLVRLVRLPRLVRPDSFTPWNVCWFILVFILAVALTRSLLIRL